MAAKTKMVQATLISINTAFIDEVLNGDVPVELGQTITLQVVNGYVVGIEPIAKRVHATFIPTPPTGRKQPIRVAKRKRSVAARKAKSIPVVAAKKGTGIDLTKDKTHKRKASDLTEKLIYDMLLKESGSAKSIAANLGIDRRSGLLRKKIKDIIARLVDAGKVQESAVAGSYIAK